MSNGDNINSLADFEEHLRTYREKGDQWGLMEFTARCVYHQSDNFGKCQRDCKGRLRVLEDSNQHNAKVGGGIGGGIGAAVIGAIYVIWYFLKNQ